MNIIQQVKSFFEPFPVPGSLAYRVAMWQYDRKFNKKKDKKNGEPSNEFSFKEVSWDHDDPPAAWDVDGINKPIQPKDIGWDPRFPEDLDGTNRHTDR